MYIEIISFNEMSSSEQSIIDAFEGKDSYSETMDNTDYFITKFDKLQLIKKRKTARICPSYFQNNL